MSPTVASRPDDTTGGSIATVMRWRAGTPGVAVTRWGETSTSTSGLRWQEGDVPHDRVAGGQLDEDGGGLVARRLDRDGVRPREQTDELVGAGRRRRRDRRPLGGAVA